MSVDKAFDKLQATSDKMLSLLEILNDQFGALSDALADLNSATEVE